MEVPSLESKRLAGKKIALCITGSIAAVEGVKIARELRRHGATCTCYMSRGAAEILHPYAMEFATGKEPVTRLTGALEHLSKFDLIIVAPATANTVSKIAHGIADNPVTSLIAASNCPIIIAPSMNRAMYDNNQFQKNLKMVRKKCTVVEPLFSEGAVKLPSIETLMHATFSAISKKDLKGKRIVITAGPTREPIDPVRVITNRSSGKMGVALAVEAGYRGADVTLIYGPGSVDVPEHLRTIRVETAKEMADAVRSQKDYHIFIGAAAVSDFTVKGRDKKLDSRRGGLSLELRAAPKTLSFLEDKSIKVGFKAEYNVSEKRLIDEARGLIKEWDLNFVVANDVSKGVFGSDEAETYLVYKDSFSRMGRMKKTEIAGTIMDKLAGI